MTSALQRAVAAGRGADGAAVAADLAFAWSLRGRCAEGLAQVRRLEAALDPVPPPLRWAHAFLAAYSGEMESGFAVATVAAQESAAAGDDRSRARALTLQGMVLQFADPAAAEGLVTEAAALAERVGDDWCRVEALQMLAYTHLLRADLPAALGPPTPRDRRWSGSAIRSCGRGTRRSGPRSRAGRAGSPRRDLGSRGCGSRWPSASRSARWAPGPAAPHAGRHGPRRRGGGGPRRAPRVLRDAPGIGHGGVDDAGGRGGGGGGRPEQASCPRPL